VLWWLVLLAAPLAAQHAPEVRGRVVDALSGLGIGGAELRLGDGDVVRSATDGSFLLRALRPGPATLDLRAVGYAPQREAIDLANGAVHTLTLTLMPRPVELTPLVARGEPDEPGVTRIEREVIEASGALDLGDLLQREAGLVVTRTGGPGSPATLSLRGASAGQVLVLLDGVPLNQALGGATDLSQVRLEQVERVTILRGAQSARYGAGALGGAIAIETARPVGTSARLAGTIGSFSTRSVEGRAGVGGTGAWSASLGGAWNRFGGDFSYAVPAERGGGVATRVNSDATDLSLDGVLAWAGRGADVRVRGEYFDIDRGMPGTVVQPSLTGRQTQQRTSLGLDSRWSAGALSGSASLSLQRQDAHFTDPSPPFTTPFDDRSRATTVQALANASRPLGALALGGGVEVRHVAVSGTTLSADAPAATDYAGVWISTALPLLSHQRSDLRLSVGARADLDPVGEGVFLSPQVGLSFRRDWWLVQARWARAFSPPGLADLYFQEGVRVEPNPDLAAERVLGEWLVGFSTLDLPVGPLTASARLELFQSDIDGMILWSPDFRFVWSPDNFDVRRRGGELSVRVAPTGTAVRFSGAVALSDVRYAGPVLEGQVIYRPRWSGVASADARIAGFEAGASFRHVGSRRTSVGTELNALPQLNLLDLRISRTLGAGALVIETRAVLENVFGTQTGMLPDFPLPGRMLRLSLGFTHT
jgi:outer membrane cobalamin receptor